MGPIARLIKQIEKWPFSAAAMDANRHGLSEEDLEVLRSLSHEEMAAIINEELVREMEEMKMCGSCEI